MAIHRLCDIKGCESQSARAVSFILGYEPGPYGNCAITEEVDLCHECTTRILNDLLDKISCRVANEYGKQFFEEEVKGRL